MRKRDFKLTEKPSAEAPDGLVSPPRAVRVAVVRESVFREPVFFAADLRVAVPDPALLLPADVDDDSRADERFVAALRVPLRFTLDFTPDFLTPPRPPDDFTPLRLRADDFRVALSARPLPLCFPPPSSLFTVAQARRSESSSGMPESRYESAM